MEKDYILKSGDEYLVWWEAGTLPSDAVESYIALFQEGSNGSTPRWNHADGHRWAWSGMQKHASRFTWAEARDVAWNKLKSLSSDGLGNRTSPPRTDRWRYKLTRIVPTGDVIRPAEERRRR